MFEVRFSYEEDHKHAERKDDVATFSVVPELGELVVIQEAEEGARDEVSGVITKRWWSIRPDDQFARLHITLGNKAR